MQFVRDRLVFLGLVALDEAASACRIEPIEPSIPLRVVVAMLHALAGGDRAMFDEFLATLRMTGREGATMQNTIRHTRAHTSIHKIARKLGCELDINLSSDIDIAQRGARFDEEWEFRRFPRLSERDVARHRFARAFYEATRNKNGR